MKVASRHGEAKGEKCPRCLMGFQDHIKIKNYLWACFECGTVFMPKQVVRQEIKARKEAVLAQAQRLQAEKDAAKEEETSKEEGTEEDDSKEEGGSGAATSRDPV